MQIKTIDVDCCHDCPWQRSGPTNFVNGDEYESWCGHDKAGTWLAEAKLPDDCPLRKTTYTIRGVSK